MTAATRSGLVPLGVCSRMALSRRAYQLAVRAVHVAGEVGGVGVEGARHRTGLDEHDLDSQRCDVDAQRVGQRQRQDGAACRREVAEGCGS